MHTNQQPARNSLNALVNQILEQQSLSTAYRRGAGAARNLHVGDLFISEKWEAIKRGYLTHTAEHRLFLEGFRDALQEMGVALHADPRGVVTAITLATALQ